MDEGKESPCLSCKHLKPRIDGAGFVTYFCGKQPGIVVGESNYLDGFNLRKKECSIRTEDDIIRR